MKILSKYKGKLHNDDVEYIIHALNLTEKRRSSAYQYFVHGLSVNKIDLHDSACKDFILQCERCYDTRTTHGIIRKWLYGVKA